MGFKDIYKNISEDLVADDIFFDEEEKLAIRLDDAESRDVVINGEITFRIIKSEVGYLVDVFGRDLENPIENLTFWKEDLEVPNEPEEFEPEDFDEPLGELE